MVTKWPVMERRGPAIDDAIIEAFERRLGNRLPDDYRRFLLEVNGGDPADSNRNASFGFVSRFLSLAEPDASADIESANLFPEPPSRELLYIGYDSTGTDVYVVVAGDRRGQIWIQDTEDPQPEGSNPRVLWHDRRDMRKVADSFADFVRQLGPMPMSMPAAAAAAE